jgi:mycofactocin precursor
MSDSNTTPESTALAAAPTDPGAVGAPEEPLVDELLVEEISIDGMCGVY